MPAPTPPAMRQRLLELHSAGQTSAQIACQLSLPDRTVRRLVALARRPDAPAGLPPLPNHGGRSLVPDRLPLRQSCLRLRQDNPGWGAGRIRLEMQTLHAGQPVPPRAPSSAGCVRLAWPQRQGCWSDTCR